MCKPLWFREKKVFRFKKETESTKLITKKSILLFAGVLALLPGVLLGAFSDEAQNYAQASVDNTAELVKVDSPLFEDEAKLFASTSLEEIKTIEKTLQNLKSGDKQPTEKKEKKSESQVVLETAKTDGLIFGSLDDEKTDYSTNVESTKIPGIKLEQKNSPEKIQANKLADKLYEIVGESPIREMVPFISQRDEKVAAFLVGIAKKESSFGFASPSKDGQTCYNYWGYKGSAGRGTGMGYACFASAEEAIKTVGDRIEVLVGKERNTPARMVDTWKCGRSCAGDPGAPGWVSTVALYFNKIVDSKNS